MRSAEVTVIISLLVLLAFATLLRNQTWYQERWLWSDAVAKSGKARAHVNYGASLQNEDGSKEALELAKYHYVLATQKDPYLALPYLNLGELLVGEGSFDAAEMLLGFYAKYGKQKKRAQRLLCEMEHEQCE